MTPGSTVSAAKEFDLVFLNTSRTVNLIGMNVIVENYRPNWRTAVSWFIIVSSIFITTCTLWSRSSDMVEFFQVVPFGMIQTQGFHKMIVRLIRPADYRALFLKSQEIFQLLDQNKNNNTIMYKPLRIATLLQKGMYVLYLTTVIFLSCMPAVVLLILGQKLLAVPLFMPLVDENTMEGFLINYVSHLMMLLIAACGFVSVDNFFLAVVFPISAYTDALENEVQELNTLMDQPKPDEIKITEKLNLICEVHSIMLQYESMMESHFNVIFLVKFGAVILGVISNIIVIFKSNFPQAYFLNSIFLVQLTQYCLMGTVITTKNEQLLEHLYKINFYRLPCKQAKHLSLMLHQAQNASKVTIGMLAPLNVESYVAILKTIYTYVMMLATFLE